MTAPDPARAWEQALERLPDVDGRCVLDLGCGEGEGAAALAARGARVLGLDLDAARIEAARARGIPGAGFRVADLREPLALDEPADGLWCAYGAAYFCDLAPVLQGWARALRPGGWALLLEVDDLFDHAPLDARWRALLAQYSAEAARLGRYDFRMGRRLADEVARAGLRVEWSLPLDDPELACRGALGEAALASWRARMERMTLLREAAGADAPRMVDDLLACLARDDHRTGARVHAVLARRPD